MNKKTMLARATASGMLLATLAQVTLPVAQLTAGAISPSSYTQTAFDADVAEYKKKLAEYDTAKAQYDRAKEQYDNAVVQYTANMRAYETNRAAHERAVEEYNAKKAEYDRAKAAYDTAKAKYDQDKQAYDAAVAASTTADQEYQRKLAEYNTAMQTYRTQKADYDAKKASYDRIMAEAEANKNTPGYLSTPTPQNLIFLKEPNADVRITGPGKFWQPLEPDKVGNAAGTLYSEYTRANGSLVNEKVPVTLRISDNLETYPHVLQPGQSVTASYTNLKQSFYGDKKIARVDYIITHPTDAQNDATFFLMKDPTNGLMVADGDNDRGGSQAFVQVRFYDEQGRALSATPERPMLLGLSSLNSQGPNVHRIIEKVRTNMEFMKINGSEVDLRPDGYAWSVNDITSGGGPTGMENHMWDQADNPLFYVGGGVGKMTSGDTIEIEMRAVNYGYQWMTISSAVSAKAVPVVPFPPTEPTQPTPPKGDTTLTPPTPPVEPQPPTPVPPFTQNPPLPPVTPVPPNKPQPPVGPTSIVKSVSKDGNTFVSATSPADALDVGTQRDSWIWKMDVTLSNHTRYESIVIEDRLENIQSVRAEDITVLDAAGKDVTAQGDINIEATGNNPAQVKWTAKSAFVQAVNDQTSKDNLHQPKLTMKIRTTAANADGASLRRFLDTTTNKIVVPNTAKVVVTGRSGGDASHTVTEVSTTSHVTFKGENEVSNPEKKVSDLNERSTSNNHLGLVDRNQRYHISFDTGSGAYFSKLRIADQLPSGFTAKQGAVRVVNTAGKDITSLFDIALNGQNLTAALKESAQASTDLVNTKVTLTVEGTAVRWLGDSIKNTATIEDGAKTIKTNETVTVIPKDGGAVKEVTADGGNTYKRSESDTDATVVPDSISEYTWRKSFTLPTRTQYTKVEVIDTFETVQSLDQGKIRVTDGAGTDVTALGGLTITKVNDKQSHIKWVGGADYLSNLNAAHGKASDTPATLTMEITTDVSGATAAQLTAYQNGNKDVIIPNVASIMLRDDSGITTDYKMDTNVSKVSVPSIVDNTDDVPTKTVTDADEVDATTNHLGFNETQQTYSITATTAAGHSLGKLNFRDELPKAFTTALDRVAITTADGAVVTDLFDLSLTPENVLSATLKESAKSDKRLIATEVTLKVTGDVTKGLGDKILNDAQVEGPNGTSETETVTTFVPSTPTSTKSVSVDGGQSFVDHGSLAKRGDEYIWKAEHKLANFTEYEAITLSDELEGIQSVDKDKITVLSYDGQDITAKGELKVDAKNGKNLVTWAASKELIADINAKFGKSSKDEPRLTMTIATDVAGAKNFEEAKLFNAETGKVEIPNTAGLKLRATNKSGIDVTSNTPKVDLPTPGESSAKKFVAKDGDNPAWSDKLQLTNFDEIYQYRTEFKLADNFNFDEGTLSLTDHYESVQSYDKVIMTDASGADITAKFDVTVVTHPEQPGKMQIKATPKRADDFDDAGATINMVIKGVKLTGVTGHHLTNYLTATTSDSGFTSGVTIPNVSTIKSVSHVPGQSQDKTSNKTHVNFDLKGSIDKRVEDEVAPVVNPKDATPETSLADLVASSQKLLATPEKASTKALKKLSDALTKGELSSQDLLTLLIEAAK